MATSSFQKNFVVPKKAEKNLEKAFKNEVLIKKSSKYKVEIK